MMTTETRSGTRIVIDSEGGVWWPNDAAAEEIETSDDPDATALRFARDFPMCGEWHA